MACRGLGGSNPAMRVPPGVYQREMAAARELGLPVTVHASGPPAAAGQIAALAADGLLGPDLQVVHANSATPAEIAQLAEAGCAVSLSPFSELLIGYGLPQTAALLAAGIRGRPVRGHHRADRQRGHVRDHETDPGADQRHGP